MSLALSVRPAVAADYEHFVRFFTELGVPEGPPARATWEAELAPSALFLHAGGEPIGYGMCRILGDTGHVVHVVVDPAHRGNGVGEAVMRALAARLRGAGCSRWFLNVKIGNTPALRLYERMGLARSHTSVALSFAWERVSLLPREDGKVEARWIEPAEDEALEDAFGLARGRLADQRASGGRVLLRLVDPARPGEVRLGLASFAPALPMAAPFAVARPGLIGPLLDALRPHTRAGDERTRVLIEGDEASVAALREAGAEVLLEIVQLRGEIPAG